MLQENWLGREEPHLSEAARLLRCCSDLTSEYDRRGLKAVGRFTGI